MIGPASGAHASGSRGPHRTNRSAAASEPPAEQVRAAEAMDEGPALARQQFLA